ncbi:MAG: class I SAM-dependent methyltransferase [Opitutaceae bacterium]|nr:class I SAM-dependent methyltransferase [Opitutaceae bacterium]
MQETNYEGLEASLYDLIWQDEYDDEAFYSWLLSEKNGKILEVACGTGRILIPLLQRNWDIQGLDASETMLNLCKKTALAKGLNPLLHHQKMEEMSLPEKYDSIFLPGFSFQLLTLRDQADQALQHFRNHLNKDGQLIISTFVPWDFLQNAEGENIWRLRKETLRPKDNTQILCHEALATARQEQLLTVWNRYEVISSEGKLLETELRRMIIRWYFQNEFLLLLEKAGFKNIETFGDFSSDPAGEEHSLITYRATL